MQRVEATLPRKYRGCHWRVALFGGDSFSVGTGSRRSVNASLTAEPDAQAAVATLWRALGFRFGNAVELAAT